MHPDEEDAIPGEAPRDEGEGAAEDLKGHREGSKHGGEFDTSGHSDDDGTGMPLGGTAREFPKAGMGPGEPSSEFNPAEFADMFEHTRSAEPGEILDGDAEEEEAEEPAEEIPQPDEEPPPPPPHQRPPTVTVTPPSPQPRGWGRIAAGVGVLVAGAALGFGANSLFPRGEPVPVPTPPDVAAVQAQRDEARRKLEATTKRLEQLEKTRPPTTASGGKSQGGAATTAAATTTTTAAAPSPLALGWALELALGPETPSGSPGILLPPLDATQEKHARAHYTKAENDLSEAIGKHKAEAGLHALRAWVRLLLDRRDEAKADLDAAFQLDPKQVDLVVNRVAFRYYDHTGDYEKADEYLGMALKESDKSPAAEKVALRVDRARFLTDHARRLLGEAKGAEAAKVLTHALKSAEAALAVAPDDEGLKNVRAQALMAKGRALEKLGQPREAIDAYSQALPLADGDPGLTARILTARGIARSAAKGPKSTTPVPLKQGRSSTPPAPSGPRAIDPVVSLVSLLILLEDPPAAPRRGTPEEEEALKDYDDAIEKLGEAKAAGPLYHKGRLLLRMGRAKEAYDALQKAAKALDERQVREFEIDTSALIKDLVDAQQKALPPVADGQKQQQQLTELKRQSEDAEKRIGELDARADEILTTLRSLADARRSQLQEELGRAQAERGAARDAANDQVARLDERLRRLQGALATAKGRLKELDDRIGARAKRDGKQLAPPARLEELSQLVAYFSRDIPEREGLLSTAESQVRSTTAELTSVAATVAGLQARVEALGRRLDECLRRGPGGGTPQSPHVAAREGAVPPSPLPASPAPPIQTSQAPSVWGSTPIPTRSFPNEAVLPRSADRPLVYAYRDGLESFLEGDYTRALALFDASLTVDPRDARALYYRGLSRYHLGQAEAAAADWQVAAQLERADLSLSREVSLALVRVQGEDRRQLERFRP